MTQPELNYSVLPPQTIKINITEMHKYMDILKLYRSYGFDTRNVVFETDMRIPSNS